MKPQSIYQPRVNIELGDFIYIMGQTELVLVQEIRSNRREISSGAIPENTPIEVEISPSGGWAKGELPDRIVRLQGLGINDTTGNGRVTDLKLGNDSALSTKNATNIVLDTNTCGESGGATAIGQLRWGALPIDIWLWDDQVITAVCNSASGATTFAIDLDVIEIQAKKLTLKQVETSTPATVVLVSRHGSARKSWEDFTKIQAWL